MRQGSRERAAIVELIDLTAQLLARELCDPLTAAEVASFDMVCGKALDLAAAFTERHSRERPIAADDLISLVEQRSEVQRWLREAGDQIISHPRTLPDQHRRDRDDASEGGPQE